MLGVGRLVCVGLNSENISIEAAHTLPFARNPFWKPHFSDSCRDSNGQKILQTRHIRPIEPNCRIITSIHHFENRPFIKLVKSIEPK